MRDIKECLLDKGIVYDNEYLNKYVNLIYSNIDRPKETFKTNRHHIIPRSYYKMNNVEVDNSSDNLVNLMYKDHALAHYYFALCTSIPKLKWEQ